MVSASERSVEAGSYLIDFVTLACGSRLGQIQIQLHGEFLMSFQKWALIIPAMFAMGISHNSAQAETKSRIPPMQTYQQMLNLHKENGWVAFRNFDGQQLIYFTALQTLHCRLKEIRYSLNSKELDRRIEPVDCNPQNPFAIPDDVSSDALYISESLDSVSTVAVQVVWEDDTESEVAVYEPCEDVGEQSCAWPLE